MDFSWERLASNWGSGVHSCKRLPTRNARRVTLFGECLDKDKDK